MLSEMRNIDDLDDLDTILKFGSLLNYKMWDRCKDMKVIEYDYDSNREKYMKAKAKIEFDDNGFYLVIEGIKMKLKPFSKLATYDSNLGLIIKDSHERLLRDSPEFESLAECYIELTDCIEPEEIDKAKNLLKSLTW